MELHAKTLLLAGQSPLCSSLVKIFGASLLLLLALVVSGCTSYVSTQEPGESVGKYQRFFVKSNFDDNHGIDGRIVQALQDRGLTAEKGPLTLQPRTAQAVVTYQDNWNWDFKNHMTGLRITITDVRTERAIARGTYSGQAALLLSTDDAIERLLNKILGPTHAGK